MDSEHTQYQDDDQRLESQELSRLRAQPPLELPAYETRQFLGAGAYGEVWVAIDRNTGRKVAIKFYTKKANVDWSDLSREVEKLVFLSADRYVVQLLDVGWDTEPPYYVMEYVDGGSLQQLLDEEGPLPVGEAVEMFREIANGLVHAHGKGVLHCDLKPANILLDQDRKPRLADFGQSRLSHEQRPALGTLFFMAPEQADLRAVPDARWDVYALGALLYCMLTGKSPYRSDAVLSEIDSTEDLESRLEAYRDAIKHAPIPSDHRQMPGVDRELADIADRCLTVDPARRFPNVQSVLTSLRTRDATKDRQPLLLLGLLGPLLFLSVLGVFGWSAYHQSVKDSDAMVRTWAHESSRFAAKFVSENVARRIDFLYRLTEEKSQDERLVKLVQDLLADGSVTAIRQQLVDESISDEQKEKLRADFIEHTERKELARAVDELLGNSEDVASWFITDVNGIQLALAVEEGQTTVSTVGLEYSRRAYFHGGEDDFEKGQHYDVPPLDRTKLSPVFRSEASGTYKVAVSTPMLIGGNDKECIGVIALTVELGKFGDKEDFKANDGRFFTLVDGREGSHRGQILQHPIFNDILDRLRRENPSEVKLPDLSQFKVPVDSLPGPDEKRETVALYRDPMVDFKPEGDTYDRNWIVAKQTAMRTEGDTGLIVLVQEDYDSAAAPVKTLGDRLLERVGIALGLILASFIVLWLLVVRALRDPNEAKRRMGVGAMTPQSSLHSMETLELPDKLRERAKS